MHFNVYDVFYLLYYSYIIYLNIIYVDYLHSIDLMNSRKIKLIQKKESIFCRVLDF